MADGLTVLLRGIALVRQPVVLRVFLREFVHVVITVGLGKNTGGSDGEVLAVALDDGGMGDVGCDTANHRTVGLETITIGYRNTVIKGLMRGFIGEPCIFPCLVDTDLRFKGTDEVLNVDEEDK